MGSSLSNESESTTQGASRKEHRTGSITQDFKLEAPNSQYHANVLADPVFRKSSTLSSNPSSGQEARPLILLIEPTSSNQLGSQIFKEQGYKNRINGAAARYASSSRICLEDTFKANRRKSNNWAYQSSLL